MTEAVENPLRADPAFAAAPELVTSGALGQLLAVYGVARARQALDDPLTVLGLPLVDEIVTTVDEAPASVTAMRSAEAGRFEHWSLVLSFQSGLRATLDVGAGMGAAQSGDLDIRMEWSGSERVVIVDPTNVAVTVTNEQGSHHRSAEVIPIADSIFAFADHAREMVADPPPNWRNAAAVISAARASAASNAPVVP